MFQRVGGRSKKTANARFFDTAPLEFPSWGGGFAEEPAPVVSAEDNDFSEFSSAGDRPMQRLRHGLLPFTDFGLDGPGEPCLSPIAVLLEPACIEDLPCWKRRLRPRHRVHEFETLLPPVKQHESEVLASDV